MEHEQQMDSIEVIHFASRGEIVEVVDLIYVSIDRVFIEPGGEA